MALFVVVMQLPKPNGDHEWVRYEVAAKTAGKAVRKCANWESAAYLHVEAMNVVDDKPIKS